jgi:hypothetical protein
VLRVPATNRKSLIEALYFMCGAKPRDNPGYVRNERKYLRSDETKTLDFSALCGAITGFGTQRSQVQVWPLQPIARKSNFNEAEVQSTTRVASLCGLAWQTTSVWRSRALVVSTLDLD